MVLEYLFLDKNHKEEIEKHNYREEIDTDNAKSKVFQPKVMFTDFDGTDNWAVRFELKGDNLEVARYFSNINKYILKFNPIVLQNDSSAYFNQSLYPLINKFERLLRKFLYLKSIFYKGEKLPKVISDLEKKDFGEIYELLFVDKEFGLNVKKITSNPNYSKTEIIKSISEISETTTWDAVVGDEILSDIKYGFSDIKNYRNDVMHAHNISFEQFNKQKELFKRINSLLSQEIENMVNYPVAQENSEIVVETLSDRLQLFDDKVMHAFENAFKLIDLGKKLSSIEIKPEYKEKRLVLTR